MRSAVESVNGRRYTVQQGAQLYGTSGSSEDWAFARHILDPTRPVIDPYPIRVQCDAPAAWRRASTPSTRRWRRSSTRSRPDC